MKKYGISLRNAWKLIQGNWKTWILFLVFYNVVSLALYTAVTYGLYVASIEIAGVSYLARNTLGSYLLSPFTWLYFFVSFFLCLFFIVLEMGGFYKLYDASRKGEKIGLTCLLLQGIKTAWRGLHPRNWLLFLLVLLMLPILGFSMASNMSYSIFIPGFILSAIKEMKFVYALLCVAMVLSLLYTCCLLYSVAAFVLDESSFKQAAKKSRRLIKNRFFFTVFSAFLSYFVLCVVFAGAGALIGLVVVVFTKTEVAYSCYVGALFGYAVLSFFGPALLLAQNASLYYEAAKEKAEMLPEPTAVAKKNEASKVGKVATVLVFFACVIGSVVSNVQDSSLNVVKLSVPEIAAHRGDSGNAPENTMPAFKQAVEEGCCDWIELDVHQTKDGVIVVTHDDSLYRIDGSDRCVYEMTYQELLQVDFGSRFSEKFAGTKVATLNEVLDYCKGKIKLQIEIKPTEYDKQIEEAVVKQIRDHDMVNSCVVLSLEDAPLRRIKEFDPEITTMYCMALAVGEITNIDFAEYISIEEQNVSAELINSMHAQNRKCFVWTINSTDSLQYLVDCGADVILTDYPVDIYEGLKEVDYSGGIARTLRLFVNE